MNLVAKSRLDVIIFVLRVYAFHDVFCYAGKCFDTSVIDITFTTPYVFLYLEEVLEKKYSIAMQLSTLYDTFFLCIQKIGPKKAQMQYNNPFSISLYFAKGNAVIKTNRK